MRRLMVLAVVLLASACTLSPRPGTVKIRSLAVPIVATEKDDSSGDILGLERTSTGPDGKIQANVLVVHGMGWTKLGSDEDRFGFDVIHALEAMYGVKGSIARIGRLCPQLKDDATRDTRFDQGGLMILARPGGAAMRTDAPLTTLWIKELACLDRIVVDLGARGVINVYRLFWDDPFYNAYQYSYMGYDDGLYGGQERTTDVHRGYEKISDLRAWLNQKIKTDLVTYGFSDATMYLGPAGERVREAVRGGICAIVNESTGQTRIFEELESRYAQKSGEDKFVGESASSDVLCSGDAAVHPAALTIIARSLGSRVVFDVLTQDMTPELSSKLKLILNTHLEVFLLANQIPLLGLGRMSTAEANENKLAGKTLRFIAVSEINDPFTYELVPYFEHLYFLRCPAETSCDITQRMAAFRTGVDARSAYIKELGYEVIDVRARFANNLIPFLPIAVNPFTAHEAHLKVPLLRKLLVCGAENGIVRQTACAGR